MKIIHNQEADKLIVSIEGKVDTLNAPQFESYLAELTQNPPYQIIVDCNQLEYISSAGLRVLLINAKKAAAANSTFALKNLNDTVKQVLDITGFTPLFTLL